MTNNAGRQYRTAAKMSQTDCARMLHPMLLQYPGPCPNEVRERNEGIRTDPEKEIPEDS